MTTRNKNCWALVALFVATLVATSGALGCNESNGPVATNDATVGTDNGPDNNPCPSGLRKADGTCPPDEDIIYSSVTTDSSSGDSTETDATAPDPCAKWMALENATWHCVFDWGGSDECTTTFYQNTDNVTHCSVDCDPFFILDVNELVWGAQQPPTEFTFQVDDPNVGTNCYLGVKE